jgi:SpoVK/Ycf46/Vps4 family AAA+-type ATPase
VDLPDKEERAEIFGIHLNKRGRDASTFDLEALADASSNFSGAEIEEAINSALYDAFYDKQDIRTEHVVNSLSQTVPLAKTMAEQLHRLRQWAEGRARHASVAKQSGELQQT